MFLLTTLTTTELGGQIVILVTKLSGEEYTLVEIVKTRFHYDRKMKHSLFVLLIF